jgi:hypothetical protein
MVEHAFQNADIVIGTKGWLTEDMSDKEVFPLGYKIHRRDGLGSNVSGVFVAVRSHAHVLHANEIERVRYSIKH